MEAVVHILIFFRTKKKTVQLFGSPSVDVSTHVTRTAVTSPHGRHSDFTDPILSNSWFFTLVLFHALDEYKS